MKKSDFFEKIKKAVTENILGEPFTASEVNSKCENVLLKSKSFLSKHAKDNPGKYTPYFIRISRGLYKINSLLN